MKLPKITAESVEDLIKSLEESAASIKEENSLNEEKAMKKGLKRFDGEGYTIYAYPKSCFFCKHCTDIFYDFTNGPYSFSCDLDSIEYIPDRERIGLSGKCIDFKED